MFPELFRIGNFPINTYGVLLALALLCGIYIAARVGQRDGVPRERMYDLCLWMVLGAIAGSKILLLLTEPDYRSNIMHLFSLDFLRSGGVFYGGLLGAILVGYIGVRRYGLPWWKVADAGACGIPLGQAIGRLGCFSAGCCWGKPTNGWFGVHFPDAGHDVTGVPNYDVYGAPLHLHPTQLYESAAAVVIFFFLLWLHKRKRFSGQVFLAYAMLYSLTRFTIEFYRDDPRGDIAGLTTLTGLSSSQMISLILGIAAVILYFIRKRRAHLQEIAKTPSVPESV
ncbi:MAG: prolipoprotein diacylglyceryl transferase [Acidobacteria bacterium]|nr:prolipoprotein diacylglyceryl transferase [Acidobacteriota bacterium]